MPQKLNSAPFFLLLAATFLFQCSSKQPYNEDQTTSLNVKKASWSIIDTIDYTTLNADIELGKPTMDVGVYLPSNLDPNFKKITLDRIVTGLQAAKEIYAPTGVQVNVLWIKTGEINPSYLSIQANKVPGVPNTGYINLYLSLIHI